MARLRALLLILAVWAAIYLPGLGTLEIKGEEGRRILPAIAMLQSGDYVVPYIGSDAYFSKPPLVNWLVAGSFQLFGARNEWTARLPSALCILAVAIAFVTVSRASLGSIGSLIAALVWMTNFGMIEKGRLIEIEALYTSLTGLAFICWMSWWRERRSPWLTWVVPWMFLGLGLLAKGPLHLVFFYAVVVALLYQDGELRKLWHPAHFAGVALMLAIFAAWAVPYLLVMQGEDVGQSWTRQFSGRLSGEDFHLSGWLKNIPRGLAYLLPWTFVLGWACFRRPRFEESQGSAIIKGLSLGIASSFVAISLLPGSLPRYTMPLLVPAAWLVALFLIEARGGLPGWLRFRRPAGWPPSLRVPGVVAALVCLALALYAFALMPMLRSREKIRSIARQINAVVPGAEPLYAIDPDYQPFLFYVRDPIVYRSRVSDVPADARYLLVQPDDEANAVRSEQWQPRKAQPILRLQDYRKKEVTILEIRQPS